MTSHLQMQGLFMPFELRIVAPSAVASTSISQVIAATTTTNTSNTTITIDPYWGKSSTTTEIRGIDLKTRQSRHSRYRSQDSSLDFLFGRRRSGYLDIDAKKIDQDSNRAATFLKSTLELERPISSLIDYYPQIDDFIQRDSATESCTYTANNPYSNATVESTTPSQLDNDDESSSRNSSLTIQPNFEIINQHDDGVNNQTGSSDELDENGVIRSNTLTRNAAATISAKDLYEYAAMKINGLSEEHCLSSSILNGSDCGNIKPGVINSNDDEIDDDLDFNFPDFTGCSYPFDSDVDIEEEEDDDYQNMENQSTDVGEVFYRCDSKDSQCAENLFVKGNSSGDGAKSTKKRTAFRHFSFIGSSHKQNKQPNTTEEQLQELKLARKPSRIQRIRQSLSRTTKVNEADTEFDHTSECLAAAGIPRDQQAESSKEDSLVSPDTTIRCKCRQRGNSNGSALGRRNKILASFTTFSPSASTPSLVLPNNITNSSTTSVSEENNSLVKAPSNFLFPQEGTSRIRRSWSHMEPPHLKALLKFRKVNQGEVKRRNTYAYTDFKQESNISILGHDHTYYFPGEMDEDFSYTEDDVVHTPVDLCDLQKDVEKATTPDARNNQMRKFVAYEIYSTEYSYLQHLKTLKKLFMDPCYQAAKEPGPTLTPADVPVMFAHIDGLIRLSTKLVRSFVHEQPWREGVDDCGVGKVFLKLQQQFEVYHCYAQNHKASNAAIKRADQKVLYRKFLRELQRTKESKRLDLRDYLIMPIQRITRYCLLLQELKKFTLDDHPDYADLITALENLRLLARRCNDVL